MKKMRMSVVVVLGFLLLCLASLLEGAPLGSAFTYQGKLVDSNYSANGLYDFKFKLYDDANSGTQIGSEIDKMSVDVIDGYSTVELDFGSGVFDGNERWLEIEVKTSTLSDPNAYAVIKPRQKITPAPYVMYAKNAGYAQNAGNADMLDGYHANAFAPSIHSHNSLDAADGSPADALYVDNAGNVGIGTTIPTAKLDVNGNIKANAFFGDGSGLTNLPVSGIPSGVIVMWSGTEANIPSGWALCNGSNGTPDLKDRFVIGAGGTYSVSSTGGTINHTHTAGTLTIGIPPVSETTAVRNDYSNIQVALSDHHHDVIGGNTGTSSNLPPYYALAYIMKL